MTRIIPGFAAAAFVVALALPGPAAADTRADGARPAQAAATDLSAQRRRVVRPRYVTPRYWRRTPSRYWGPYYQPWPSYGVYPYVYRPYYGWGGPMPGYRYGYTW